jgi:hypothetical protein
VNVESDVIHLLRSLRDVFRINMPLSSAFCTPRAYSCCPRVSRWGICTIVGSGVLEKGESARC